METKKLKVKEWYIAKNHPERGPGQLKKIVIDRFHLVYHPGWSGGLNGNGEYQGNHCAWYSADLLIEAPPELVYKQLSALTDQQGWIATSELLPKSNEPVLCYHKDTSPYAATGVIKAIYLSEDSEGFKKGWYRYDDFYDGSTPLRLEGEVTHWMPLPAPPEEVSI